MCRGVGAIRPALESANAEERPLVAILVANRKRMAAFICRVECSFKLNPKQSPRHLDIITLEGGGTALPGIYEVKGDELQVCFRHAKSGAGGPEKFETGPESQLTLIVLKRQKP